MTNNTLTFKEKLTTFATRAASHLITILAEEVSNRLALKDQAIQHEAARRHSDKFVPGPESYVEK